MLQGDGPLVTAADAFQGPFGQIQVLDLFQVLEDGFTDIVGLGAPGTPGKRLALPHSRILIHQPYTEGGGQGSDIEIQANEIQRMRLLLEEILSLHTGQTIEKIRLDIERDRILTAQQAKEYGIVDDVIATRKLVS